MIEKLRTVMFVLLVVNVPLTMNEWLVGRITLWVLLLLATFIMYHRFRFLGLVLPLIVVASRLLALFMPDTVLLYDILLSLFFAVTGAICFADNPKKLGNLLVGFLLLCMPVMLMQMSGVLTVVMYWNTDYAHTPELLALNEVGTFKDIPLFPTFLMPYDSITYQIGQGRPSGLMPANNLLSVLICFALLFNMCCRDNEKVGISDAIVNIVAVLSMSKLVFAVSLLLYAIFFSFKSTRSSTPVLQNVGLLAICFGLYYLFFPGLFFANLSAEMFAGSIGFRLYDLMIALGVPHWADYFWFSNEKFGIVTYAEQAKSATVDVQNVSAVKNVTGSNGLTYVISSSIGFFLYFCLIVTYFTILIAHSKTSLTNRINSKFYMLSLPMLALMFTAIPVLFKSILFCFIMGVFLGPIFAISLLNLIKKS